jgi:hypothetical protein
VTDHEPQTVAGAMSRIAAHEAVCAERYRNIEWKMNVVLGGLGMVIMGMLGWLIVTVYTLEPLRAQAYSQTQTSTSITHTQGASR